MLIMIGTCVCLTQDYHPPDHISFATSHTDKANFDTIEICFRGSNVQSQRLWPPHCIMGTSGSEIHKDLIIRPEYRIFRKGYNKNLDR